MLYRCICSARSSCLVPSNSFIHSIRYNSTITTTNQSPASYNHVLLYDYTDRIVPYDIYSSWQQQLIKNRFYSQRQHPNNLSAQLPDLLILCQHSSTYTLGRNTNKTNILFSMDRPPNNSTVYHIDRGGDVTYHDIGQLVIYPILNLNRHTRSLHWYIRHLEQLIINTLQQYSIYCTTIDGLTGVWCDNKKICAIGLNASKWITSHGCALNIDIDLNGFKYIVPCGINDRGVTSIQQIMDDNEYGVNSNRIQYNHVKQTLIHEFEKLFNCRCELQSSDTPLNDVV